MFSKVRLSVGLAVAIGIFSFLSFSSEREGVTRDTESVDPVNVQNSLLRPDAIALKGGGRELSDGRECPNQVGKTAIYYSMGGRQ